jgi:hypothetical protein
MPLVDVACFSFYATQSLLSGPTKGEMQVAGSKQYRCGVCPCGDPSMLTDCREPSNQNIKTMLHAPAQWPRHIYSSTTVSVLFAAVSRRLVLACISRPIAAYAFPVKFLEWPSQGKKFGCRVEVSGAMGKRPITGA